MQQPIFYRHYDMKDRVEQSQAHHWFWNVTPMTTATPVHTAIMDDFGFLRKIEFLPLAFSLANSDH